MGLWGCGGGRRVCESPAHDCSAASPLQSWHGAGRQAALHEALLVHLHKHITGSEWVRGPSGLLRETEEGRVLGAGGLGSEPGRLCVAGPRPLLCGRRSRAALHGHEAIAGGLSSDLGWLCGDATTILYENLHLVSK